MSFILQSTIFRKLTNSKKELYEPNGINIFFDNSKMYNTILNFSSHWSFAILQYILRISKIFNQ